MPSVEYLAALEHLKDGEWHDREKTMRRVMDAVPPGKAMQMAERLRIQQLQKESRPTGAQPAKPRRTDLSMDRQIEVGARAIARSILNSKRRFERNGDQIRLVPDEVLQERRRSYDGAGKRSWETRLRAQGIDPATYKTKEQFYAEQRAIRATWTPEQWRDYRREKSRKGHATRRKMKENDASSEDLPGRGGPE